MKFITCIYVIRTFVMLKITFNSSVHPYTSLTERELLKELRSCERIRQKTLDAERVTFSLTRAPPLFAPLQAGGCGITISESAC
jgi:hypothetical protein